jgi:signal transduction histidine kinase
MMNTPQTSQETSNSILKIRHFSIGIVSILILIFLINFLYDLYSRKEEEESIIRQEAQALITYHLITEKYISDRFSALSENAGEMSTPHLDIMSRMRDSFRLFSESSDHTLKIIGLNARMPEHQPDRIERNILEEMSLHPGKESDFFYHSQSGRYYFLRRMNFSRSCLRCHVRIEDEVTAGAPRTGDFAGAISLQIPSAFLNQTTVRNILILVLFTLLLAAFSIIMVLFFLRRISTLSESLSRTNAALEVQNRKLRQLESFKTDLFHMLVHDMKAPLTFMIGSLQMLLEKNIGPLNEEQDKMISLVLRGCNRLRVMISNILDINRLEDGKLEMRPAPIPICDFLDNQSIPWMQQAEHQKKSLEMECRALKGETIVGDANLLARILENLVSNALKHTPPHKGHIRLLAEPAADSGVLFSVLDNGEGIPPEFMEHLFEKYSVLENHNENRSNADTGLGLFFCKLAVETMGGRIWAKSEPGQGASFFVHLPPILPARPAVEAPPA